MDEKTQKKIELLRLGFLKKMPEKIAGIESGWQELQEKRDLSSAEALHRLVHNLKGTSATFGCNDVSQLAAEMEKRMEVWMEMLKARKEIKLTSKTEGFNEFNQWIQELKSKT
jgi:chemotaxis protein histidine kinase CheA